MRAVCLLLSTAAVVCQVVAPPLPNFTGYVVTAQWDGRTVPDVQWALDVTRQDTEFRARQELKLIQLIPTTLGDASYYTYTAYDEATRVYTVSVARNDTSASFWGMGITKDVENVTALIPEVRYAFPARGAVLVGLELFNNKGTLIPLALFKDGTVLQIDPKTGATKVFAQLVNASTQVITTAIELDPSTQKLWAIGQQATGLPNRFMVTLDLNTKAVTSVLLAPLKNHNQELCAPFEMVWMPSLQTLMVFNTGNFDQLIYTSPASGETSFATLDMAQFIDGEGGHFEFTQDPFLEMDDTWANACIDNVKGWIYFQCSSVTDDGDITTTLCQIPVLPKEKELTYINVAIQPMTYGYAGMQYVQVVS